MHTPEELSEYHDLKKAAIFNRFVESENVEVEKSEDTNEDVFFTVENVVKFKDDLLKAFDEGKVSKDHLEKSIAQIKSLKSETREIEGKEVEVYVFA